MRNEFPNLDFAYVYSEFVRVNTEKGTQKATLEWLRGFFKRQKGAKSKAKPAVVPATTPAKPEPAAVIAEPDPAEPAEAEETDEEIGARLELEEQQRQIQEAARIEAENAARMERAESRKAWNERHDREAWDKHSDKLQAFVDTIQDEFDTYIPSSQRLLRLPLVTRLGDVAHWFPDIDFDGMTNLVGSPEFSPVGPGSERRVIQRKKKETELWSVLSRALIDGGMIVKTQIPGDESVPSYKRDAYYGASLTFEEAKSIADDKKAGQK